MLTRREIPVYNRNAACMEILVVHCVYVAALSIVLRAKGQRLGPRSVLRIFRGRADYLENQISCRIAYQAQPQ